MTSTKPFTDTVQERIERDPQFKQEIEALMKGEIKPRCSKCRRFLSWDRIDPNDWVSIDLLLCDNCG